jgi:hypothetical protein
LIGRRCQRQHAIIHALFPDRQPKVTGRVIAAEIVMDATARTGEIAAASSTPGNLPNSRETSISVTES